MAKYNSISRSFSLSDKVVIADDKDKSKEFPQIKCMKWNNNGNISVRLSHDSLGNDYKNIEWNTKEENDKIILSSEYVTIEYYLVNDSKFEETSAEMNVIINKMLKGYKGEPLTFFFTVKSKNLVAYCQDNGSWEFYHNAKSGNEYKAGMSFRIDNVKVLGTDNTIKIDLIKETASFTINANLKDAKYPLSHVTGATFGYTSVGASSYSFTSSIITGTAANLSENGTISKISVYFKSVSSTTSNFTCAIYNSDGTYTGYATEEINGADITVDGWNDFEFASPPSLNAGDYKLVIWQDKAYGANIAGSSGSSGNVYDNSLGASYPNWPTIDGLSSSSIKSMYATYTASGGGDTYSKLFGVSFANYTKVFGQTKSGFSKIFGQTL